jgi:hypothetical protein
MKAHKNAEFWTVDEVAEALDGVSMETSGALWMFVPATGEPPSVKKVWSKLSDDQQREISEAFDASDREWEAGMERARAELDERMGR